MKNKYNIEFSIESINKNIIRLVNQCWKLIPMRENDEDWTKQLDTVVLELVGLNEIFYDQPQLLQSLSKLEGLRLSEVTFDRYRKAIFEIISLMQGLRNELV